MISLPDRRARRAARHREQVAGAVAAATWQQATFHLLAAAAGAGLLEGSAPVEPELTDDQRKAAHEAFKARLRAAQRPGEAEAAMARVRAAQARLSPHPDQPAGDGPDHDGGSPWKPKSSVSTQDHGRPSDLRKQPTSGDRKPRDLGSRYDRRNDKIQARMRLLDQARPISTLYSLQRCGQMALGGAVAVTQKGDGSGGFSGLFRCGSVWSCPECAPVVRAERAANMETWAAAWMGAGHGVAMATLTTRHWKHSRLGPQLEGTAEAWRALLQGSWWAGRTTKDGTYVPGFRDRHGIVGIARALEMTHSWSNSWHSHIHALLWFETPPDDDTARQVEAELYARWAVIVARKGLGKPTRKHGVKVDVAHRGAEGAADLARYLVKLQDKDDEKAPARGLGNELLRGDNKIGRKKGRTPFEILRRAVAGDEAELELWVEYEKATKGRRMLTWSGDIRDRLDELVDVRELEDQDVVLADDARNTTAVLVQVRPEPWRETVAGVVGRRGQLRTAVTVASATAAAAGLDLEETARAAVRDLLEDWGLRWGTDILGPDIDLTTGELVDGEHVTPQRRPRPGRTRWQTSDELDAGTHVLGIRPTDYVRPQMAARRAAGLPIARQARPSVPDPAAAAATVSGPVCVACGGRLNEGLTDARGDGLHLLCHPTEGDFPWL